MIIKSLELQDGLLDKSLDSFSEKSNLIFSDRNSRGKSTFLRLLFYSLGYPIPNMRGMDFSHITTTVVVENKEKVFTITRQGLVLDVSPNGGNVITYSLPSQHESFLSYIFGYEKIKVLKNILGIIYIDQDKGWSLLNRGTVIGKIKFGIEELLAGLNNKDVSQLLEKRKNLNINKSRYEAVLNMQKMQKQIYDNNNEFFTSDEEKTLLNEISFEKLKCSNLRKSLKEINSLIQEEEGFFNYINSMRLFVKYGNERIPVNSKTLDNSFSIKESLKARKSIIVAGIERQEKKIRSISLKLADYRSKTEDVLFEIPDIEKNIVKRIAQTEFNVDQQTLADLVENLKEKLKETSTSLKEQVKKENVFVDKIYKRVIEYAKKLHIDENVVYKQDYIFTSELKLYSGAILQKLVFAFKLAFLKVIEEDLGTKLFMVLDSPKNKELDEENTALIMDLVKTELKDNQVFIASIYDFDVDKKIKIVNRAIEAR